MDIGTLTGSIALEDQVTDELTKIASKIVHFAENVEGLFGAAAIGVGVFATAVLGAATAVANLGVKGSTILGVEEAFDALAVKAGTTGEALIGGLSAGVRHTVDSMELMQSTSRLLSSGFKLNAEDARLLGGASREMGKATGTDAAQGLGTLSSALLTGRTRGLAMAGIVVDLKGAEETFAASLGVTAAQLSETGKLESKRIAILDATRTYVDRLGTSELSFKEKLLQATVAVGDWWDRLAKGVASSSNVMHAVDAIGGAIMKAFGGDADKVLTTIVGWVNSFADAVATYGPPIIQTIADIWHGVINLWHEVQHAWDLVPDWFKNIARDAAIAGIAVGGVSVALHGMTAGDIVTNVASFATIWSGFGTYIAKASTAMREWIAVVSVFGWEGFVFNLNSIRVAFIGIAGSAGGIAALFTALAASLYQVGKAVASFGDNWKAGGGTLWGFLTLKEDDTFARRWLGLSKSVDAAKTSLVAANPAVENLDKALAGMSDNSGNWGTALKTLNTAVLDLANKGELTTPMVNKVAAAIKASGIAAKDIADPALRNIATTMGVYSKNAGNSAFITDKLTDAQKKMAEAIKDQKSLLIPLTAAQVTHIRSLESLNGLSKEQVAVLAHVRTAQIEQLDALDKVHAAVLKVEHVMPGLTNSVLAANDAELVGVRQLLETAEALRRIEQDISNPVAGFISLGLSLEIVGRRSTEIDELSLKLSRLDAIEKQNTESLSLLADGFVRMGQAAGGSLGSVLSNIGQMVVALDTARKMTEQMGKIDPETGESSKIGGRFGALSVAFSKNASDAQRAAAAIQSAAAVADGAVSVWDATASHATRAGNALGGLAAGAKAGAAFGPYGIAIGAAAGLIVGLVRGKPEWAKAAEDVGRDFGTKISDALAKEITALEKSGHTSRLGAELIDLSKIIGEAGGLSAANLEKMTARFHDTFSMIEIHQLTVAQGTKIMDENFAAFAEACTDNLGILSKDLVEIIKLNDQFGTQSKTIAAYVAGQMTNAQSGFAAALGVTATAYQNLASFQNEATTATGSRLDDINAKMVIQQGIIDATAIHTQAAATAISDSLVSIIAANMSAGMSFVEALTAAGPSIEAMSAQLEATGFTGGAAFDFMREELALVTDDIAGPALESIHGYADGLVGMANAGLLNADSFRGITEQIALTEAALEEQGFSGKALHAAMQGDLQRIWELQQANNYIVDAGTQALLDQAAAEGLIGETHKSTTQQMLDASNRMVDVLEAMATFMGVELPKAANAAADGIQKALDGIKPNPIHVPYSFDAQNALPDASYTDTQYRAGGGMVLPFTPRGSDVVPVMATPGERVLSVSQNKQYEMSQDGGPDNQEVIDAINGLRGDMAGKLPRALARAVDTAMVGVRMAS